MVQIYKAARKKATPAKDLKLKVDALDHHGNGVSRSHQPVVFVEGALPGEVVMARVQARKKRFWQAQTHKVIQASPERIDPFCPYFGECGGCQHQHVGQLPLLNYKQEAVAELLQKAAGIDALNWQAPLYDKSQAYRRKVRLAVDARRGAGKDKAAHSSVRIGFRARQSDTVVDIHACQVLTDPLQAVLPALRKLVKGLVSVRHLGHISMVDADNQLQLCLRMTQPLPEADRLTLQEFSRQQHCSILLQKAEGELDAIAGEEVDATYAPEPHLSLAFRPTDFIQVNHHINQAMVNQAMNWLDIRAEDKVLDLFCGVGNFALPMASRGAQVIGIEGSQAMVEQAQDNAHRNSLSAAFIQADLSDEKELKRLVSEIGQVDKVLLDPARAGASAITSWLQQLNPAQILYVSCNPATFTRDAAMLVENRWRVDKIGLMDMFPNTAHTELMALFARSGC
ncbi:23S rRNA (uracil(1939)-C(5))-methyltransferase RlmD [Lacimicrobium sp. SS2-24]|uniref:23S rRNA (uracil(1939)-C(5))-methyltransferase RlmD n=1 Tax=Lacimicrobium sp. SS2-24 TaxID=2005569 RepID=UPI000B4B4281|nr:23S rRNA (uracil(1939)-C(5))-methyltransferase RlmD [Lacimicrobium sp. SS2-24]